MTEFFGYWLWKHLLLKLLVRSVQHLALKATTFTYLLLPFFVT
jgi:hypothetical protein